MLQVDWPPLIHDLGLGHPLKFLWEERAQHLTTYSNLWKQFYRKFPQCREASVTARESTAGERVEVDYAGDPIERFDLKTGEVHQAWVFVAVLGFSPLLYACAAEDMQSGNWLGCHRRMFAYYGLVSDRGPFRGRGLAQRATLGLQLESVAVMHGSVEYCVRQSRLTEVGVPCLHL